MRSVSTILTLVAVASLAGCASAVREPVSFKMASWNIGHFALGKNWKTAVPRDGFQAAARKYADFLDEVNADYLGVCEYAGAFTTDGQIAADQAVFGRYGRMLVGPHHGWQWNAAFWNRFAKKGDAIKSYRRHLQDVYYLANRVEIGGVEVVLVQTHLDWGTMYEGHEHDREEQMKQIIADFAAEPRVIVAGDFNIGIRFREKGRRSLDNPAEYRVFEEAGYTLGNDGRFKTAPSGDCRMSLDNIIVKGVEISDFRVYDRPDLSDHALVSATITVR